MPKNPSQLTLLYPLRKPFSNASVRESTEHADISFEIDGDYAGTLRVPIKRLPNVLLHVFADTNRAAGHIVDGRAEWVFDPDLYNYLVLIDDNGGLHDSSELT